MAHVNDGDTITIEIDGRRERVRLIGINTPEQGECLAEEARAALVDLVDGGQVLMEGDVEDRDQFGRLLRYVWVGDTLVNAELVARGLAVASSFEPNVRHQDLLDRTEATAEKNRLGLWNPSSCGAPADLRLEIVEVVANPPGRDEENLNGEQVLIRNLGPSAELGGLVLRDGSSVHRYVFPPGFRLEAGATVTVHVGCGSDSADRLYWCAGGPVWDNGGDEAFLVSPGGSIVASFDY